MRYRDYYQILGVPRAATADEIRFAHRTLARQFHPDTAPDGRGNAELFADVMEAYEFLSNPDARRRYDGQYTMDRNEAAARARRHPPKTPCDVCGTPVYASQRHLYLGRYMCKSCVSAKPRGGKLLHLMSIAELRWQLNCLWAWAHSHMAAIVVVLLSMTVAGARVAWVAAHSHHPPRPVVRPQTPINVDDLPAFPVKS